MPPAVKKNKAKGQTTLEAALGLMLVVPTVGLFLLAAFHVTGWIWTEYWAYQSLHCLFESGVETSACRRTLEEHFAFHPGEGTAKVQRLALRGERAELYWVYEFDFGFKEWKVEKKWTLIQPRPQRLF